MGMDVYIVGVEQKVNGEWIDIAVKGSTGYLGRRNVFNFLEEYLNKIKVDIAKELGIEVYYITLKGLNKLQTNFRDINEVEENQLIINNRLALCFHYLTCLVDDSSENDDNTINELDLRIIIRLS